MSTILVYIVELPVFNNTFGFRVFLKELEGYKGRPEDVGHGFVRNAHKFKELYVEYCKNMPESNRVILMPESSAFFDVSQSRFILLSSR